MLIVLPTLYERLENFQFIQQISIGRAHKLLCSRKRSFVTFLRTDRNDVHREARRFDVAADLGFVF